MISLRASSGSQAGSDPPKNLPIQQATRATIRAVTGPTTGLGTAVRHIMPTLRAIEDQATLDEALGSRRAVLYKHSTRCPVSAYVFEEVRTFAESHPAWKVFLLKVIEQRTLSDVVAAQLAVPHQSPQVFIIKDGHCVWNASHSDINEQVLVQQTG